MRARRRKACTNTIVQRNPSKLRKTSAATSKIAINQSASRFGPTQSAACVVVSFFFSPRSPVPLHISWFGENARPMRAAPEKMVNTQVTTQTVERENTKTETTRLAKSNSPFSHRSAAICVWHWSCKEEFRRSVFFLWKKKKWKKIFFIPLLCLLYTFLHVRRDARLCWSWSEQ